MGAVAAFFEHFKGYAGVFFPDGFSNAERDEAVLASPDQEKWSLQSVQKGGCCDGVGTYGHAEAHPTQGPGCCGASRRPADQCQQLLVLGNAHEVGPLQSCPQQGCAQDEWNQPFHGQQAQADPQQFPRPSPRPSGLPPRDGVSSAGSGNGAATTACTQVG